MLKVLVYIIYNHADILHLSLLSIFWRIFVCSKTLTLDIFCKLLVFIVYYSTYLTI